MPRTINIVLSSELYRELELAAADASTSAELGGPISPTVFAKECVEAALAARRLDRMTRPEESGIKIRAVFNGAGQCVSLQPA